MIGTGIGLGLAGYRLNPPGVLPVLDLRFATDKSLTAFAGPTPSFSRASSGTYFDANGVLQSAGVNAARFNHVYNGTSWVSRGLLVEEQRTNLLTYSNTFSSNWTPSACTLTLNDTTSPEGLVNAAKITSSGGYAALFQTVSVASSTTYTVSVFAKAGNRNFLSIEFRGSGTSPDVTFDLSSGSVASGTGQIVNVGNGWFRCSFAKTSVDTSELVILGMQGPSTSSLNGDYIYIFGCQLEAGAFASSVISTTSSSATRSADVCQITGSDFSGFWNQSEGTFAAECDVNGFNASGVNYIGVASVGSISQYAFVGRFNGSLTALNFQVYNGSPFGDITYTAASATPTKTAFGMKANDCAASVNGGAVSTDNTVTMTTALNQLEIGNFLGANHMNGHIARLRYYPTRLENGTLRVLST